MSLDPSLAERVYRGVAAKWRVPTMYLSPENDPVGWQEQLRRLFGDRDELSTVELLLATMGHQEDKFSWYEHEFHADRLAKLLTWARHENIVAPKFDGWRLLDRGPTFMNVGPAAKQMPIRIKDVKPHIKEHVEKLVRRELKRRERAHWRLVEKRQAEGEAMIDKIAECDPMYPLKGALEIFEIGSVTTILGARKAIIEHLETLDEAGISWIMFEIKKAARDASLWRGRHNIAPELPDGDLDLLGQF